MPFTPHENYPYLVLCKPRRLCYTLRRANTQLRLFLGSSAVEHSTVNRMVAGSNPARGASKTKLLARSSKISENRCVGIVLANRLPPCPTGALFQNFRRRSIAREASRLDSRSSK